MGNAISVFAWDITTKRIVHIQDVPEGYSGGVCPDCDAPMVSSNRNKKTRQVDCYFRHKNDANCAPESSLHLYAKQLLMECTQLILPAFNKELCQSDLDGKQHGQKLNIKGKSIKYRAISKEKGVMVDGHNIIPDVTVEDEAEGLLYIEVYVTNRVKEDKEQLLIRKKTDAIEINLSELHGSTLQKREELDKAILVEAPRKWLFAERYQDDVKTAQKKLDSAVSSTDQRIKQDRNRDRRDKEKLLSKKREIKTSWRSENIGLLDLISRYQDEGNQRKAHRIFDSRLGKAGTIEYQTVKALKGKTGQIPDVINHSVPDECVFNVHRVVWQNMIFEEVVLKTYDRIKSDLNVNARRYPATYRDSTLGWPLSTIPFKPSDVYNVIQNKIPLSKIARLTESMAEYPINTEAYRQRDDVFKYLSVEEYISIPKPIPTIRRYLVYLTKQGILSNSGDTFEIPYQDRPTLF